MQRTVGLEILRNVSHQSTWDLQEAWRAQMFERQAMSKLFLVEHRPTITLGRGEKGLNLQQDPAWLTQQGFDVVTVNRGGKVTYHGPGQLVAYPVLNLQDFKMGIKDYICKLEKTMLELLAHFTIEGHRLDNEPGVYVEGKKIGSVGIHVRKFISIHGLAFNVAPDLTHFHHFTPCGIPGMQVTSLQDLGVDTDLDRCLALFVSIFEATFDCKVDKAGKTNVLRL